MRSQGSVVVAERERVERKLSEATLNKTRLSDVIILHSARPLCCPCGYRPSRNFILIHRTRHTLLRFQSWTSDYMMCLTLIYLNLIFVLIFERFIVPPKVWVNFDKTVCRPSGSHRKLGET